MEKLAKVILKAAEIRESSWSDLQGCYLKPIKTAADQAVSELDIGDERMGDIVYLLLNRCWNDSIEWAKEVLKNKQGK